MTVLATKKETANVDALERLVSLTAEDMKRVNSIVLEQMASPVDLVTRLAAYIIASGGKRLRPMLTVAAAKLCGYEGERHHKVAACVEFIHTATLLHDDVVDESVLRRGAASANAVFGNQASVLVGDFLFSRAFQLMVEDGPLEIPRILSKASAVMAEGEVMQLVSTGDLEMDMTSYLKVVQAKTAALFAASCSVGAVVAGASNDKEKALHEYGTNLGIAFQIIDDVLDYSSVQQKSGKNVGIDFGECKVTLPIMLALESASADEKAFWQRTMGEGKQEEGDFAKAVMLMQKHSTFNKSIEIAHSFIAKAKDNLSIFETSQLQNAMMGILDFIVDREF